MKKQVHSAVLWTLATLTLFVGIAQATSYPTGNGSASTGTDALATNGKFKINPDGSVQFKYSLVCNTCPVCPPEDKDQLNYRFSVVVKNALGQVVASGGTVSGGHLSLCACATGALTWGPVPVFPGPAASVSAQFTVWCTCCEDGIENQTGVKEALDNAVPTEWIEMDPE